VEGGTAAITYIFNSLRANYLLGPGDTIALGVPIFTPYLEIPHMNDYQLVVVNINADKDQNWQYAKTELDKLRDPKVRWFTNILKFDPFERTFFWSQVELLYHIK
jgi:aspartate 4-decarboxylase